ncbi:MAG: helix-turn-helix domain-containing protein [Desulfobulbus sp.]
MVQQKGFSEIWERVKEHTELKTFIQLADMVGTTHQYVSRKKSKNEFPANWAFLIANKYGISTDWIMTGNGKIRLNEENEINPLLIDVNEWLNEEKKEKDPEFRILFRNQMVRAFFDYEKWLLKRGKTESGEYRFPSSKVA